MKRIALLTFLAVLSSFSHLSAQLNREQPEALQSVGIDEKLGDTIPLNTRFATSNGDRGVQ